MQLEAFERVVERILAQAAAYPEGVVAVDADGTLWSGDVGDDAMWALIDRGAVLPVALEAIDEEAKGAGVSPDRDVRATLLKLHQRMTEGAYDEERFCELNAWMAAGRTLEQAHALAVQITSAAGVASRIHEEMRKVVGGLRSHGVEVFVVSASPRFIVAPAAALLGFDRDHILAADVVVNDGVIAPAAVRPIPYGAGKVARLRERIGGRRLLGAFGDNVFDVPMLEAADVRVAVRAKARLRAVAERVVGLAELAPSR